MDRLIMLLLAIAGIACIYAGYTLFCGLPAARRLGRRSLFFLNVLPGALLALAGMTILTAQVVAFTARPSAAPAHRTPTMDGATWRHDGGNVPTRGI